MGRTQADNFSRLSPQSQRAALFDQARQQASQQGRFLDPRNLGAALPGGLTEKQRMDFMSLQRTNPQAAEKQLLSYQRNADIRYNKPTASPQPPAGPTYHRPSTNYGGPRRSFGA